MINSLEYNTQRSYLVNREFGRNIQKFAEFICTIEDKATRQKAAETLIRIMATLAPRSKEDDNYLQKLWDHLHIIAHYELDVESPYPKPIPNKLRPIAQKPSYPKRQMKYGQYGILLEKLIQYAAHLPYGEEKDYLAQLYANLMKRSYLTWNKDSVTDDVIKEQLLKMSNGRLQLKEDQRLSSTKDILFQARNHPIRDSSELFPEKKMKKKKKRR